MEIFKGIFDFFKKEIKLNKEYYDTLGDINDRPLPKVNEAQSKIAQNTSITSSTSKITKDYTKYTVYFTNGQLSKISPYPEGGYYENRDIANNALSIVSDGIPYDLTSKKSIYAIAIPNYSYGIAGGIGTTGFLEYVLRMRSGNYWNEAKYDLSIACLEKATQLMKHSTMGWPPKDFYRIVNELNDLGKFKSSKKWKNWIDTNIPGAIAAASPSAEVQIAGSTKESFKDRIASCKELGTDLIEVGDMGACCQKCAMYRKRVYSLSGRNKLFPKFPSDFHYGCGLSGWPYIYGINEPSFDCNNIISYSNRPFVDDRTGQEKENHENWLNKLNDLPEVIRTPSLTRIIYYRLKQILPDDTPKSISGFSRMRNANSKNYQVLVKKAEAAGFVFPETLEDVEKWDENQ